MYGVQSKPKLLSTTCIQRPLPDRQSGQSLCLFHATEPVYKDHLSNAISDRPIQVPMPTHIQLHPVYKDHYMYNIVYV